jgi:hypothetical protein
MLDDPPQLDISAISRKIQIIGQRCFNVMASNFLIAKFGRKFTPTYLPTPVGISKASGSLRHGWHGAGAPSFFSVLCEKGGGILTHNHAIRIH